MKDNPNLEIYKICIAKKIHTEDIKSIQAEALKQKQYHLIIHLNKNIHEYLDFLKKQMYNLN